MLDSDWLLTPVVHCMSRKRLVNYSSDSSDDNTCEKKVKTVPCKVPLPPSIGLMFGGAEVQDDPSQSGGRTRSFPHLRGNWVSHVYIQLNQVEVLEKISRDILGKLIGLKFESLKEFHLSLSRILPIPHHWLQPLVTSLKSLSDTTNPFIVTFDGLKLLPNDDKTRYFVTSLVDKGIVNLSGLVEKIDAILSEYKLPVFYCPPSFHTSLLWTVHSSPGATGVAVEKLWHQVAEEVLSGVEFEVEAINFKTGHKIYTFQFKN